MKHQEMHDRADPDVFCLYLRCYIKVVICRLPFVVFLQKGGNAYVQQRNMG